MAKIGGGVILLFLGALIGLSLSACGKRATHLDPPSGDAAGLFPAVYPDPATDPSPAAEK
jgi:hypothetical protein